MTHRRKCFKPAFLKCLNQWNPHGWSARLKILSRSVINYKLRILYTWPITLCRTKLSERISARVRGLTRSYRRRFEYDDCMNEVFRIVELLSSFDFLVERNGFLFLIDIFKSNVSFKFRIATVAIAISKISSTR